MKGMNRIKRGRGFRGLLDYLAENRDGPAPGRLIGGTMSGTTPRELAAEFKASRQLRPDIEKPVWHNSLRMPAGEDVSDEKWDQIARDYMTSMGWDLSKTQVCWQKHDDEAALHIVASRIYLDGTVYLGQNENLISTRVIQELEHKHGLTITKGPEYDPATGKVRMPDTRQPGKNEVEKALRTKALPPRQKLQRLIDGALAGNPSAPQFVERLTAAGVKVQPNLASTGRCNGLSFELDGVTFKGSDLGKSYSWSGLQQKGMSYEQERDYAALGRYRAGQGADPTAVTGKNLAAADANLSAARGAAANLDRTAGNIADRAARRAVGSYLSAARRNRGEAAGIDCSEGLDRRQAYKTQLLEDRYHSRVSSALAARLVYVQRHVDRLTIKLRDGGRVIDHGDRMLAGSRGVNDDEVRSMVELAKLKGWASIEPTPTATNEFKARLWEIATAQGLALKGYIPTEEQRQAELVRQEREWIQRAHTVQHHTPRPN